VLALLGPNGAGKTTLVRILTTLLRPDSGRARVAGFDVVADAGRLRSVIGLAGHYAAVDELLTGRESLELVEARVTDPTDLERAAALLAELAQAEPHLDHDQQRVGVPTTGGTSLLLAAGRRFEEEQISLDDLGIRRPSLDDVSLALTGKAGEAENGATHPRSNSQ
jgi:ABC-type branched-subunit amino acid transport system ATPase component